MNMVFKGCLLLLNAWLHFCSPGKGNANKEAGKASRCFEDLHKAAQNG
jgi:hypothetical protein